MAENAIDICRKWDKETETQLIIVTNKKGLSYFTRSKEPYPSDTELTNDFKDPGLRAKHFQEYYS